mgnify:CR=1 FL=1
MTVLVLRDPERLRNRHTGSPALVLILANASKSLPGPTAAHPPPPLSAPDLVAVLLLAHCRCDWERPHLADNDPLSCPQGHASPLLYSMFRAVGAVSEVELVNTYRQLGARLEGHPTPVLPWVDVATGSLGQGLPDAVGVGLIVGVCWVATSFGINYLFARRSLKLWLIDAGYHTLQFALYGLVLGLWH